ncbi:PASTA domain-containing protein [Nocardioides sp. C4-1]|uniref:PASTA domain-containing protein n=1 Tax=Nocardioides sp. C4-1 TaxID=3151851 RepID=UPI0032664188
MDEQDLMEALEHRVGDVPVGPAPVAEMTTSATRTRRRRGLAAGAAAAVVAVVGGLGVAQVVAGDDPARDGGQDVVATEPDVAPAGYRYVGLGRAAIAVPEEWAPDEVECNGTPTTSTYVVGASGVGCMMLSVFPDDTDVVRVDPGRQVDTSAWAATEVDGVPALRSPVAEMTQDPALGGSPITSAQVYLPDDDALFTVESTVSRERVDELLDGVVRLDDRVGVPGFADLGADGGRADDAYVRRLEALGLEVELLPQLDRMQRPPGEVIDVEPRPGTVVAPGSTVQVRAAE